MSLTSIQYNIKGAVSSIPQFKEGKTYVLSFKVTVSTTAKEEESKFDVYHEHSFYCVAFGDMAKELSNSVKNGDSIKVGGIEQVSSYVNDAGESRISRQIVIEKCRKINDKDRHEITVAVIGFAGSDGKYFDKENPYIRFNLGVSHYLGKTESGKVIDKTDWVKCIAFEKIAKDLKENILKGGRVKAKGVLTFYKYINKEGVVNIDKSVVAENVEILEQKVAQD